MAKSTKVVLTTYQISSIEELDEALAKLAQKISYVQKEQASYNEKEQRRREELTEKITSIQSEISEIEIALEQYCTANRHIFPKDKKGLDLTHGKVMFRMSPPAVKVRKKFKLESVIQLIKFHPNKKRYADFIRTKDELNKDVILAEATKKEGAIPSTALAEIGLEITQKETFYYELNMASEVIQNG